MVNEEYNKDYFNELLERKMGARNVQKDEEGSLDDDFEDELDDFSEEDQINLKNTENVKKRSARKEMRALIIEKKINKERFDGLSFYSALMLAMFKDIIDFITLGTVGTIIGIAVDGMIGIIFIFNGSSKVETKIKRAVYMNLIEKIPILNILPLGTGFIIYVKIEQDNKVAKLQQKLRELEK